MKKLIVLILATCLLSNSLLLSARAQGNAAVNIDQIRASIVALEKLERNGTATGDVAALNHEFLTNRRKQLRAALTRREAALEEYLIVAGASLSDSEERAVQASLGGVRQERRSLDALIAGADAATADDAGTRDAEAAPVVTAGWGSRSAETSAEPAPQGGVANSCPGCLPDLQPDEKKDFIISARTGETSGKTKFGRTDRARIIVKDKNPFLYEYKVTLKAVPILEPAIATFFKDFSFLSGQIAKTEEPPKKDILEDACAVLTGLENDKTDLSTAEDTLRRLYEGEKETYDDTAQDFKNAQDVLHNPTSVCPTLCDKATEIRTELRDYKPKLKELNDGVADFKSLAKAFQIKIRKLKPSVTGPCATRLGELSDMSQGFLSNADSFEKGIATITAGKKAFDDAVKIINNVLSDPNAFSQVYTRGPFSTPTDIEVTVERRDLRETDSKFAKLGETETINFGGGARFAIAGGIVASPFETVTYKRVPAIIDGRSTTIIGAENSSNSRILPILMLHGRLFEMSNTKYISGVHLSLGITAKPNDTGTNVEWLVGPSISFIEERLFLTVGGYAGRRQVLEGNLAPGQELPADFKDDIPVNNRLVWKPGFALTYKFK